MGWQQLETARRWIDLTRARHHLAVLVAAMEQRPQTEQESWARKLQVKAGQHRIELGERTAAERCSSISALYSFGSAAFRASENAWRSRYGTHECIPYIPICPFIHVYIPLHSRTLPSPIFPYIPLHIPLPYIPPHIPLNASTLNEHCTRTQTFERLYNPYISLYKGPQTLSPESYTLNPYVKGPLRHPPYTLNPIP